MAEEPLAEKEFKLPDSSKYEYDWRKTYFLCRATNQSLYHPVGTDPEESEPLSLEEVRAVVAIVLQEFDTKELTVESLNTQGFTVLYKEFHLATESDDDWSKRQATSWANVWRNVSALKVCDSAVKMILRNDKEEISPKDLIQCNVDDDCVKVREYCCGCSEYGSATTINIEYKAEWNRVLEKYCAHIACLAAFSNEDSCYEVPMCVDNECQLVDIDADRKGPPLMEDDYYDYLKTQE